MERGDFNGAIQLFERARDQSRSHTNETLSVVSLVSDLMAIFQCIEIARNLEQISGWKFDELNMTVRQRLCDALHAAGRIEEAGKALLNTVNFFDQGVYMAEPVITWLSGRPRCLVSSLCIRRFATDFLNRCLSAENADNSILPTPPLRVWVKLQLTGGSCQWDDALAAARDVSISFCSGARQPDTPLVYSLWSQDSQFIGLSVIILKH